LQKPKGGHLSKDNEDDPNLIPYVVFEVFHGLLQFCLDLLIVYVWLVVSNMAFIFHFIYGMSSFPFPLTNSYFSGWLLHHQPDIIINHHQPSLTTINHY